MTQTLTIKQPSFFRGNDLVLEDADGKTVGEIDQKGLFRPKVSASMADHQWRFVKTGGFKSSEILVLPHDNETPVATYRRPFMRRSGVLEFDGVEYAFKASNWKAHYSWSRRPTTGTDSTAAEPLIDYAVRGILKHGGTVEVHDTAQQINGYQLLVIFGLYLSISIEDEGATAGASVAATSAAVSSS